MIRLLLGRCLIYAVLIRKVFSIQHTVQTMFIASFRLSLEYEHISVDTALPVCMLQCDIHTSVCLI